ncbi:murein biosynthesis integral membrane protein MurJ [Sphingomonas sediminicola]|jgi:putative peptidoglycan lipid II flippase|uniref:Probable lipid II flippase MurJ n=1 Tax=Sphingomonas sediminicola TaxID=386874 RepID=A0ABX6T479_9SPHN|nr:murein biosynthesis integral membrane protein MurJ [Sphingomonas sediminicola]QNP44676.1 murein biosynthesis integral membrane protein MurJ [Sphingomonas sediminicola]
MNLLKATGTIGGLTMVSRIAGFGREMLMSRVMGASWQADAFFVAFRLPNTFRRLFGEGAFSAGFVPLYSQRLQGEDGEAKAKRFSEEVLAVFVPTLIVFTLVFEIIMPLFVAAISGYSGDKLGLATFLTRITFPYLLLISLVSLFSGILNSLARFTAAAFAPALLNLAMLTALIFVPVGGTITATALSIAVTLGGVLQLGLLLYACKRAGVVLKLKRPKMTPGVRQFIRVVVPATLGAGVYQISAFIDTFFLARLGTGSLSYFNYADRLNQLPLGVIGAALGTAILPQVSKHVGANEPDKAAKVQGQAAELAMLLCLPAALALAVSALPLVSALFQGGRFTAEDARLTALTLSIVVLGLPAYVLVKVLTPGFYARQDTATPVKIAALVLVATVLLNFILIPPFGIAGLASAIAITSWLNCLLLYVILHRRGHFRIEGWLASRVFRQLLAGACMVAALYGIRTLLGSWFEGSVGHRLVGVTALVGGGMAVYFPAVWVFGGTDRDELKSLFRRRRPYTDVG